MITEIGPVLGRLPEVDMLYRCVTNVFSLMIQNRPRRQRLAFTIP